MYLGEGGESEGLRPPGEHGSQHQVAHAHGDYRNCNLGPLNRPYDYIYDYISRCSCVALNNGKGCL